MTGKIKRKKYVNSVVIRSGKVKPDYRSRMSDNAKKVQCIYYPEETNVPVQDNDDHSLRKNIML